MKNNLANALAKVLINKSWTLALAESCTGGLVSAALTEISGSSAWFERGYITYSNQAKTDCLQVPSKMIESFGAVSEQVAKAMAEGALKNAGTQTAISITGIAGPSGGTPEKPIGTVCFGWSIQNGQKELLTVCKTMHFKGDRQAVREQARDFALSGLLSLLK